MIIDLVKQNHELLYIYIYIYIYIDIDIVVYDWVSNCQSKVGNLSWGWPEGSFSIATTLRCRGGHYFIPWIGPLYSWYIPYNAEC